MPRHRQAGQILGAGADGDLDPQVGPVLGGPDHGDQVGVGDLPAAGGDQLQRVAGTDLIGRVGRVGSDSSRRVIAAVACSHSPRERAASYSRAFSMATAAVAASAVASSLVLGAELPPGALGQVEVAEHLVPDPDRHPQEAGHRRVPGREARRARVVGDAAQPDRLRVLDQRTQQPLALRQVPDLLHHVGRHADVDELGQIPVRADHPQRRVARTDQLPGRLRDPAQHHRQGQITGDHLGGPQQPAQPALGGHHLLRPLHQLPQQLVQLQPRQIRERQRSCVTGGARGGTGLLRGQRGKQLVPALLDRAHPERSPMTPVCGPARAIDSTPVHIPGQ